MYREDRFEKDVPDIPAAGVTGAKILGGGPGLRCPDPESARDDSRGQPFAMWAVDGRIPGGTGCLASYSRSRPQCQSERRERIAYRAGHVVKNPFCDGSGLPGRGGGVLWNSRTDPSPWRLPCGGKRFSGLRMTPGGRALTGGRKPGEAGRAAICPRVGHWQAVGCPAERDARSPFPGAHPRCHSVMK